MIPFGNLLSNVNGTINAVMLCGDAVGEIMLYGQGGRYDADSQCCDQ